MDAIIDPVAMAKSLVSCPSVTPLDAGAQAVLADVLAAMGFTVTRLRFGAIDNLFARIGTARPHFCFAGHTDVVPAGEGWTVPPFAAAIKDERLYGRGACDMKGAIAAFVAAAGRHLAQPLHGSISLLITGDEEGEATDGTVKVLAWMEQNDHIPDLCLVGEPTNPQRLGDIIKVGRRGSLNARVTLVGVQGHAAYPHRARNPVHGMIGLLNALVAHRLDEGSARFEPSSLQVTSVDVGNPARNVIPRAATAWLNIRFNDQHSGESLSAWLRDEASRHAGRAGLTSEVEISVSGEAFTTVNSDFAGRIAAAVTRVTGVVPKLDTGGGTSDARFIARYAPVAEFGLVGASMHQSDEHVPLADLEALTQIYQVVLQDCLV